MTEDHVKDLTNLLDLLSEDGEQIIAPCLAGIAHFETRDIGPKESFREGPEWMYRGKPQFCKDTYTLREFPIGDTGRSIKAFECTKRCEMSNAPTKQGPPYLNAASVEHLLEIFAHEYLEKVL